jgi:chromosome-anchoring protein RacA
LFCDGKNIKQDEKGGIVKMELKTSSVAARLGVSPKTIQRWVRKYNVPYRKNESGHYVFDAEAIALLEQIKFEQSATLEPYARREQTEKPQHQFSADALFQAYVEPQLDQFASRLQQIEHKLDQKADDVVSVQLLHHRQEIEELVSHLRSLEQRIARLEESANKAQASTTENAKQKKKRRGLSRIMSLFA